MSHRPLFHYMISLVLVLSSVSVSVHTQASTPLEPQLMAASKEPPFVGSTPTKPLTKPLEPSLSISPRSRFDVLLPAPLQPKALSDEDFLAIEQRAFMLGSLSIDAAGCNLDKPIHLAPSIGTQMASQLALIDHPRRFYNVLSAYTKGEAAALNAKFSYTHAVTTDTSSSSPSALYDPAVCAIAKLQWNTMKGMSADKETDFVKIATLATQSATLAAASIICFEQSLLDQEHLRSATQQASLSIALASFSAQDLSDLGILYLGWQSSFNAVLEPPFEVTPQHCVIIEKSINTVTDKLVQFPDLLWRLRDERLRSQRLLGLTM